MSGVLPPPPPAFPALLVPENYHQSTSRNQHILPYEKENVWATEFPEIQKACYFSNSRITCRPNQCVFYDIPSILQDGPTCGLTAVSMMLLGTPTPEEILQFAREREFTNFGEMFSTENLEQVIKEVASELVETYIFNGSIDCARFKEELVAGSMSLVTYPPFCLHFSATPFLRLEFESTVEDNIAGNFVAANVFQ